MRFHDHLLRRSRACRKAYRGERGACQRQGRLLLVFALLSVLVLLLAERPVQGVRAFDAGPADAPGAAQTSVPMLTARSAFVADITAGVEIFAANADEPLPPASTTKMVTALTARRYLAPEEWVTIDARDLVDPTVYSNAGLLPGDRLTVRDLLAAMLVASAGDAARALARHAGERIAPHAASPVEAFVTAMNEEAERLGLTRSRFLTPDGRDVPGQLATARDLAVAAAHVLADPVLAPMVAAARWDIAVEGPNARQLVLLNTNQLIAAPDVIGVKTGTSAAAGQCLVLAVRRGHDMVLVVVLGSLDRYRDVETILDWMDAQFRWITLDAATFPELAVLAARGIVPALAPTVLVPTEQLDRVQLVVTEVPATGRVRGTVRLQFEAVDLVVLPLIEVPSGDQGRVRG